MEVSRSLDNTKRKREHVIEDKREHVKRVSHREHVKEKIDRLKYKTDFEVLVQKCIRFIETNQEFYPSQST